MSDPIKPIGPPGAGAAEAIERASAVSEEIDATARSFEVAHSASASRVASAQATGDPLEVAFQEVSADIRAGEVPDDQAAADAVIIRLVNLRFGHMTETQRRKITSHLHEVLHDDPNFKAHISQLITLSRK